MGLKISLRNSKWILILFLILPGLSLSGCAGKVSVSAPPSREGTTPEIEKPVTTTEKPSPRALASVQLTEQGRILLESGQPDDAISVLERAINLNPTNGQNYYYLSEAWLQKGDLVQAIEFNRLAAIHLEGNQGWMGRVEEQRSRIKNKYR
jgi:tetratricopeptide (TPR) repeat protein